MHFLALCFAVYYNVFSLCWHGGRHHSWSLFWFIPNYYVDSLDLRNEMQVSDEPRFYYDDDDYDCWWKCILPKDTFSLFNKAVLVLFADCVVVLVEMPRSFHIYSVGAEDFFWISRLIASYDLRPCPHVPKRSLFPPSSSCLLLLGQFAPCDVGRQVVLQFSFKALIWFWRFWWGWKRLVLMSPFLWLVTSKATFARW